MCRFAAFKNNGSAKLRSLLLSGVLLSTCLFIPHRTWSGNISHAIGSYLRGDDAVRLKTNLAYDLFAVLNVAGEFKVDKHVSVEIPVAWSLWDWKKKLGLRCVLLQPGAKYYFCCCGSGHAVGADVIVGWYNFRKDSRRYQCASRPAWGFELNYSYTLPVGSRWLIEFSAGAGYVHTRYNTYYNIDNGALIDCRSRTYLGPTRVGISLVYVL